MKFGKVEAQDLKDAGLDVEEFKKLIGTAVSKADLETLKTEQKTALDEIKGSIASLTEAFTKGRTTEPTTTTTTTTGQKTAEELDMERQNEFATNPTDYVDRRTQTAIFSGKVDVMKMRFEDAIREAKKSRRTLGNSELAKEFDDEIKKYTPENLVRMNANPFTLIDQVHDMIVGRHHEEIVRDRDKKDGKFNLVQSGSSSGNSSTNNPTPENKDGELTAQEKTIAAKFGMTEDEWKQQGKELEAEQVARSPLFAGTGV